MKRALFFTIVISFLFSGTVLTGNVFAAVFNVTNPVEFQNAFNIAASNGEDDTINLASGTYNVTSTLTYNPTGSENFALSIQGSGAGSTILDSVDSVQILNIDATGLSLDTNAHVTIRGMTFQNGASTSNGGGLHVQTEDSDITVEDSGFSGNSADVTGGGAYTYSHGGAVNLTNNTFSGNSASGGGGTYALTFNGTLNLTNNTFSGNSADNRGGGTYASAYGGTITLTNNTFSGNSADNSSGGGTYAWSLFGSVILTNNTFSGNSALLGGGAHAESPYGTAVTLTNNTFSGNSALISGGARAESYSGTITLTNNTFSGNSANHYGGGLNVWIYYNSATANIYNNIIWGNTANQNGDDLYVYDDGNNDNTGATVNFYNNDNSNLFIDEGDNLFQGNNIDQDPLLTADFHHLKAGSPCIDTGDNNAPELPPTDKDGNLRIVGGLVDIGAYEWQSGAVPPQNNPPSIPELVYPANGQTD